jgi:hypothetical protein
MLNNIIYLDNNTTVNIKWDGFNFSLSGVYLNQNFDKFGGVVAFGVGTRIATSFVSKGNISLIGKIGTIVGTGAGTCFTFNMTTMASDQIKGMILAKKLESQINLEIQNVEFLTLSNTPLISTYLKDQNWIPKMGLKSNETLLSKFSYLFQDQINFIENPDKILTIIETIEKYNSKTINEIFTSIDQIIENSILMSSDFIHSPLEKNEFIISEIKNNLIGLLNYEFALHLIMIYFICMLIFLFTMKIIIDKKFSFDFIKFWYLGKYIHIFIMKLISIWNHSLNFWIYFILIFLLFFTCGSTYGLYACLFILS